MSWLKASIILFFGALFALILHERFGMLPEWTFMVLLGSSMIAFIMELKL